MAIAELFGVPRTAIYNHPKKRTHFGNNDRQIGSSADAVYFRALCDGLAGLELAGTIDGDSAEGLWRQGLSSLIRGLTLQSGARRTGGDRSL